MTNYNIPYYPVRTDAQKEYIGKCSKERWKDPKHHAETSAKIAETYSTEEMRAVQAAKAKPHTEETKAKLREMHIGQKRPLEVVEKIKAKRKGQAVYHKCFMTPSGAFPSKKSAIEWATKHGVNNAQGKFDKWIKQRPDEFYYIAPEEYELIKDNPKQVGLEWMQNTKRYKNRKKHG